MTDEVRQEDREAADDVFDALSERYGVPAVYRTALANDFAAHASPLRTRIAELEGALAEAREALEPFAEVADCYDDREDDSFEVWVDAGPERIIRASFKLAHYRQAREAAATLDARAALQAAGGKQDGR